MSQLRIQLLGRLQALRVHIEAEDTEQPTVEERASSGLMNTSVHRHSRTACRHSAFRIRYCAAYVANFTSERRMHGGVARRQLLVATCRHCFWPFRMLRFSQRHWHHEHNPSTSLPIYRHDTLPMILPRLSWAGLGASEKGSSVSWAWCV